jgi:hypothetical protein
MNIPGELGVLGFITVDSVRLTEPPRQRVTIPQGFEADSDQGLT